MADVAKAANVSTMTVSRVLNDSPSVSEETRTRVFAAIEKLHYRRNELARSLREQRTRQIGILIPNLFDPFFANTAHAVGVVARQHNYAVSIATTNEDPDIEFEEAVRMLHRNVEGVVVIPAASGRPTRLTAPQFSQLPVVTADRPLPKSHYDAVLVENSEGGRLATNHLLAQGHKRIAFLGLDSCFYTMHMRQQGYRQAMATAGLLPEVCTVEDTLESAILAVREVLSARRAPTALFCANNLVTQHVLHGMRMMDMFPPKPVALVGFDDFETADLLQPGITVVRQPVESLGRTAAEVLFARLGEASLSGETARKEGQRQIVLPVELVVRGSCGARPN
jgi:LacI family transcriptional regulator